MKKLALLSVILLLTACHNIGSQTLYPKSVLIGTVYDRQTNEPMPDVLVSKSSVETIYTDVNGGFQISVNKNKYLISKNQNELSSPDRSLEFLKDGYANKYYDIPDLLKLGSELGQKGFVNLGSVYMTPVPIGKEHLFEVNISGMTYCKPHESQKEVDCLPVPVGKKYEDLTNIPR